MEARRRREVCMIVWASVERDIDILSECGVVKRYLIELVLSFGAGGHGISSARLAFCLLWSVATASGKGCYM